MNFSPSAPVHDQRLSAEQIQSWREQGFVLVHNLLPEVLLRQAQADAQAHYPTVDSGDAEAFRGFGSAQKFVFPSSQSSACNEITLHPALLQAVSDLLGCGINSLRLTQSDLWPKYGHTQARSNSSDNTDQRMHCDYPNHTLTHPPPWETPEAVEIILYFNDRSECEGSTAVVPRQGNADPAYVWPITQTPGVADLQYINDRAQAETYLRDRAPKVAEFRAEHLYQRETLADYQFGSVLFYRHDTWHRGTPVKPGSVRFVQNMTFKQAQAEWVNVLHPGWSWSMYHPGQYFEQMIARLSPEQRCVLGFPAPGSTYWNSATIEAVRARYGAFGIDMSPYE